MNHQRPKYPFKIPSSVRWLAQDSNGVWWGYTAEPHRNDFGWYENEAGIHIRLGEDSVRHWQNSLVKVETCN